MSGEKVQKNCKKIARKFACQNCELQASALTCIEDLRKQIACHKFRLPGIAFKSGQINCFGVIV
jgi:hypothetical protein